MASSSCTKSSSFMTVGVLLVVLLSVVAPMAEATITCGQVGISLAPCIQYLRAGGPGAVPAPCCSSLNSLYNAARTTPDRQQTCTCIKNAAAAIPGLNYDLASSLLGKCGITLPYKLTPTIDCKSVK